MARKWPLSWVIAITILPCVVACVFASILFRTKVDRAPHLSAWTLVTEQGATQALHLPVHLQGILGPQEQTFRLSRELSVDDVMHRDGATLTLARLDAPVDLFIDGEPIPAQGLRFADGYRTQGTHAWYLPPAHLGGERVHLDLVVRYTWVGAGWLDTPPAILPGHKHDPVFQVARGIEEYVAPMSMGAFLCLALVYALLYRHERSRAEWGWFALLALAVSVYPLYISGVSQLLFGRFDLFATGVAIGLSGLAMIRFGDGELGEVCMKDRRLWESMFAALVAWGAYFSGPYDSVPFVYAFSAYLAITSVRSVDSIVRRMNAAGRHPDAAMLMFVWSCASFTNLSEGAAWCQLGEWFGGIRIGVLGTFVFAVCNAVILTRRILRSVRDAQELSTHLQQTVVRVEALNQDLARQVQARTEELSDALARLAAGAESQGVAELPPGTTVDDRWRIEARLGAGGMGTVYRVTRLDTGEGLAMKVLSGAMDLAQMARFAREAKLSSRLQHANIVQMVDVGISNHGFMYIVLEFVPGGSLARHRKRFGDVAWALSVLSGIAKGLAVIHQAQVVHRDLKPANVLVGDEDEHGWPRLVKVADFGISNFYGTTSTNPGMSPSRNSEELTSGARLKTVTRAEDETPLLPTVLSPGAMASDLDTTPGGEPVAPLTKTGMVLGTAGYMAPEVMRGGSGNLASDVFSFGVLAYEMLCGERPFTEFEILAMSHAVAITATAKIEHRCPELPSELAGLLNRCLAVRAEERPDAEALHLALAAAEKAFDLHGLVREDARARVG